MSERFEMMEGEHRVLSSMDDQLVLTNLRVRHRRKRFGTEKMESITLDAVSHCGLISKSYPLLIALAILCFLVGIVSTDADNGYGGLFYLFGVAALVLYVAYRPAILTISSTGEQSIDVLTRGMSTDTITSFLEAVDSAKLAYIQRLYGGR